MSDFVEFELGIPIWDADDGDIIAEDCSEICSLCELLNIQRHALGLSDLYRWGDPRSKNTVGGVFLFHSESFDGSFLAVDMSRDRTDQMSVVVFLVRCPQTLSEQVRDLLRRIKQRGEVSTGLIEGKLGLDVLLSDANFPRNLVSEQQTEIQHLAQYRGGQLQSVS